MAQPEAGDPLGGVRAIRPVRRLHLRAGRPRAYPVQITGHGFYWLELVPAEEARLRRDPPQAASLHRPELPVADPPTPARPPG